MQQDKRISLSANQRAIIGAVLAKPGIRRSEVAKLLGISAQTTMRGVLPLISRGALIETRLSSGGRGKPARSLRIANGVLITLGVSLASDRVRVEFCDLAGQELASLATVKTYRNASEQMADIDGLLDSCLEMVPDTAMLVAAGVSVQGYFLEHGTRFAARSDPGGWAGIDLHEYLVKRFEVPVRLMNDGKTLASSLILTSPYGHFLCLHLGSGIGGGIVNNGRLVAGVNGNAGELGALFPDTPDRPVEALFLRAAGLDNWTNWQGWGGLSDEIRHRFSGVLKKAGTVISRALEQALAVLDFEAVYLCSRMPPDLLTALCEHIRVAPLGTDLVGQSVHLRNPPPVLHPRHVPHYARLACQMAVDEFLTNADKKTS